MAINKYQLSSFQVENVKFQARFWLQYLNGDISRAVGEVLQFHLRMATFMQEATQSSSEQHVAVLAFPFGSHGLTIFKLMLKLASAAPNLKFSFFSTKKSNDSLLSASKAKLPGNIKVYDVEDGAPMKNASTESNPLEAVELFLKATPKNFKKGIDAAVSETGHKIICLLTDAFLTFSGEMARDMHVPWFPVFVAMPYNVSAHIHTDLIHQFCINSNSDNVRIEDQTLEIIPGLSMMHISDLSDEILWRDSRESLFSSMLSKLGGVLPQASAAVMNFYQELYCSSQLINDLNSKVPSLLNVGFLTQPLPPHPLLPSDSDETGCLQWLDRQKAKSVAYISFGTVATPPADELVALAEAIGESDIPFLWSLREDKTCQLPEEFLLRTSGRGKIVPWAPQTQVLGHFSIGVFVTHGGANSVCESIANGVPMICRPFFGDHRMNARMVEEIWGIGVKVEGMKFTQSGVLQSLQLMFSHEEGKKMRENALDLKKTVIEAAGPNGSATRDFKILVESVSNVSKVSFT